MATLLPLLLVFLLSDWLANVLPIYYSKGDEESNFFIDIKKASILYFFQCDKRSALFTTEAVRHEREISNATVGKNCYCRKR
jgi:hypothetical protein